MVQRRLKLVPPDVSRTGGLVCARAGHNPSTPGASRTICAAKGAEMPSYQNVTPPISLSSGDVGFSFNNEAFPGSATSGASLPSPASAAAAAEEAFLAPDPGLAR